jgi:16S rRNA (uracil1498-N3)-methyltransferase
MKEHRFFGNFNFSKKNLVIKDPAITHQAFNVLKLKIGEPAVFINQAGEQAQSVILKIDKKALTVDLIKVENKPEPIGRRVILYCSILKRDNFDLVTRQAVEVGARQIVPLICNRTIKSNINLPRLNKIVIEAVEQSGRVFAPEILDPVKLKAAFELAKNNERNFFCHKSERRIDFTDLSKNASIGVFIGPEGGWTADEVALAQKNDLLVVSLGDTVLRAETAAVVAAYSVINN